MAETQLIDGRSLTNLLAVRMFNILCVCVYNQLYTGIPNKGWMTIIHPMTMVHMDQLDSTGSWLDPTRQM